jgi:hypothetical protein
MKILALEKEKSGLTSNDFVPYLNAEAKHVYALQQKGIVREIYFNQNHEAVLILECENLNIAEGLLNNFPLVKNGLINFELMELRPYSGFSRLMTNN